MSDAAPAARARLPRPVKLFGLVSLFNDFASEMIYPLLPAFVTTVLGAGAEALGALDGAAEFAAAVVKYGAGRLSDRRDRRGRLVVGGYTTAVVVRPIIALAGAAWQVIGLRVVDRLGKGMRTPARDALIAEVTPAPLRGRAFGLQRGLDHAGAVLGPLLAWYLLTRAHANLRDVIAWSLAPGVIVLVLAVVAVRQGTGTGPEPAADAPRRDPPGAAPGGAATPLPLRRAIAWFIPAFYLLRMPDTLIILRAQQVGVGVAVVPLLWASVHVVRSSSSFVGGSSSDRFGAGRTMWVGWLCYAVLAAWMGLAATELEAWLAFLALGVVAGLTEGPERALVARVAGSRQGSGFGAYHGLTGLMALLGGVGLGVVFQHYGATAAFLASAAGGAILVIAWPLSASSPHRAA